MDAFRRVGDEIRRRYRAVDYDESLFPELVAPVLEEAALHREIDLEGLVDGVLDAPRLPPAAVASDFSDAGVCVYHQPQFSMEVLTWLDASTMAHEHGFCGAFQVLAGGSLHTRYRFEAGNRVNERLQFGRLERSAVEHLGPGTVMPILAGPRFIHRLFHLERPSITLVARVSVKGAVPQYAYLEPGIAYDPFGRDQELDQRLKLLRILRALEHPGFLERLERRVAEEDLYAAFFYAMDSVSALYSRGHMERFLGTLRGRFGDLTPFMEEAMAQRWRFERITGLRQRVSNPEHRFFLALLLNAADLTEVLALIVQRHGAAAPRELVVRWLEELGSVRGFAPRDGEDLAWLLEHLRGDARPGAGDPLEAPRARLGANTSILSPLLR